MNAYKWLVCYLLKQSYEKVQKLSQQGVDAFTAKNESQVFYLRTLSIVYIEVCMNDYKLYRNITYYDFSSIS